MEYCFHKVKYCDGYVAAIIGKKLSKKTLKENLMFEEL